MNLTIRKMFAICAALMFCVGAWADASYGILVNGTKYYAGTHNPNPSDPNFDEYMSIGVPMSSGDYCQLYDQTSSVAWVVTLDPYSTSNMTLDNSKYVCSADGCYDFYIKLHYGSDQLYVGAASGTCTDWGVDIGGGGGGGCSDGPYGVIVNATDVYSATATGEPDTEGRTQYLAHVNAEVGDILQLINRSCDAMWMVDVEPYGEYAAFTGGATDNQLVCVTAGCYDFYIKLKANDDVLYIGPGTDCGDPDDPENPCEGVEERTTYSTSAPAQAHDVMLQGFYWDSYHVDATYAPSTAIYGDTKWKTLLADVSEIGAYFDMVWLPPSAKSSGGVGYGPAQYSNQNSDWGSRADLIKLIDALHDQNTKVVADIVVNHAANKSSWCDYYEYDFGCYGKFSPSGSWICTTDEVNYDSKAGACQGAAVGNSDDGYGSEANYADYRDWDHQNGTVRSMIKAYLKYLKNIIGYDGWRYDYCKGFHNSHINDYNSYAGNYFSVMEYWDGNTDVLQSRLSDAGWNTCTFDFATKYNVLRDGIANGNYNCCAGGGLLHIKPRYAVTFVDSHDTFERDDNEFLGKGNSMKNQANKNKVLQANAYILSMPGIPCVFYPHWKDSYCKPYIKKMIDARHLVGVHSESPITNVYAEAGGFQATVTGSNGYLVVQLGNKAGNSISGFTKYVSGTGFAIWIQKNSDVTPNVIISPASQTFKDATRGVTVTLSSSFAGLSPAPKIYYTTDGSDPTTSSTLYGAPFAVKQTTTVKAIAVLGTQVSPIQEATYKYKEPQTTPIIVRFAKDKTWNAVYLYSWDASGALTGGWPGTELTIGADGWYAHQFDADISEVNFIFNNGGKGIQTSDLYTDCDVCYVWEDGCEVEDEECGELDVDFNVVVSPTSSVFRDNEAGLDVTMTAVGAGDEAVTFYYTTDGTDPTTASATLTTNPATLNFKQTTELRVFAVAGEEISEIVTNVYTYKAPQTTPLIVRFSNTANWSKVNLYSWSTDAAQTQYTGKWPGTAITIDEEGWYSYQFEAGIKSVNVIFNNGTAQTQDIYVDEDACWVWNQEAGVAHYSELCDPGDTPVEEVEDEQAAQLDPNAPIYNILGLRVDKNYEGIVIQNGHKFFVFD